jgi:hypothetical protein
MFGLIGAILGAARAAFRTRGGLVAENLALRQQLAVLRVGRRAPLRPLDRAFWVVLSQVWSRWAEALAVVKPATVIKWHRRGFAKFWAYKSRRWGRPPLTEEVASLIARMAQDNPTWSRRRIAAELAMLGLRPLADSCMNRARGMAADRPRQRALLGTKARSRSTRGEYGNSR